MKLIKLPAGVTVEAGDHLTRMEGDVSRVYVVVRLRKIDGQAVAECRPWKATKAPALKAAQKAVRALRAQTSRKNIMATVYETPATVVPKAPDENRHDRFVAEYLLDLNATKAYQRVYGASQRVAEVNGSRLLGNAEVAAKVAAGQAKALQAAELSATSVLNLLRQQAYYNAVDVLGCKTVEDLRKLPLDVQMAIVGFEVLESNIPGLKDGKTDTVRRIRLSNKLQAGELLARHFKLLTDVIEVENLAELNARLDRGRERSANRPKDRDDE